MLCPRWGVTGDLIGGVNEACGLVRFFCLDRNRNVFVKNKFKRNVSVE